MFPFLLFGGGHSNTPTEPAEYSISSAPSSITAGNSLMMYISLSKSGLDVTEEVYLSDDSTIGIGDQFLGEITISGFWSVQHFSFDLLCNTGSGSKYIGLLNSGTYKAIQINAASASCGVPSVTVTEATTLTYIGDTIDFDVHVPAGAQTAASTDVYLFNSSITGVAGQTKRATITIQPTPAVQTFSVTVPGGYTGSAKIALFVNPTYATVYSNSFSVSPTADCTAPCSGNITWNNNKETAVNRAGGGYQLCYSTNSGFTSPTDTGVTCSQYPYSSGSPFGSTVTKPIAFSTAGTYYVRSFAYATISGASVQSPGSGIITVLVR